MNKNTLYIVIITSLILLVITPITFTYAHFANDLTSKEKIMNRNDTGEVLLDRNNRPFFSFYQAKNKSVILLSQIPKITQEAVIASEDKDFYNHKGVSIKAVIRSAYNNMKTKDFAYGGSTITQQLVKNVLLNSKKSLARKYQEVILAEKLEQKYSKDEILDMYLNSVYFGQGAFGVEEAAQTYFGENAKDLDLAQSSFLAALLPAPSYLSPFTGKKDEAILRQKIVLDKMEQQKYITDKQKQIALKENLVFKTTDEEMNVRAPHFALMVRDALVKQYGEEYISRSGFKVKTTIDLDWQKYAERVVQEQVAKLGPDHVTNGAATVIDPKSGEILVMVGSKDWFDKNFGKVNMATTPRSPGSSFKPIVYAAAFEKGLITTATLLKDQPITYKGGYNPLDYDRKFRGIVTTRRALANSLNIPSVEVMTKVGIEPVLEFAKRVGITSLGGPSDYGSSIVLGAGEVPLLEMTSAYAVFANGGVRYPSSAILNIENKDGEQVYSYHPKPEQVLDPDVAFLISSILSDEKARYEEFGTVLNISRPTAVKTGTAEDYKDALTIGYTPSLAVGAWVGNNDNSSMDRIAGSLGAAPIWKSLMEKYLQEKPLETFNPTTGIIASSSCYNSASSSAHTEYFIKGTEFAVSCYTPSTNSSVAVNHSGDIPVPTSAPLTSTSISF